MCLFDICNLLIAYWSIYHSWLNHFVLIWWTSCTVNHSYVQVLDDEIKATFKTSVFMLSSWSRYRWRHVLPALRWSLRISSPIFYIISLCLTRCWTEEIIHKSCISDRHSLSFQYMCRKDKRDSGSSFSRKST